MYVCIYVYVCMYIYMYLCMYSYLPGASGAIRRFVVDCPSVSSGQWVLATPPYLAESARVCRGCSGPSFEVFFLRAHLKKFPGAPHDAILGSTGANLCQLGGFWGSNMGPSCGTLALSWDLMGPRLNVKRILWLIDKGFDIASTIRLTFYAFLTIFEDPESEKMCSRGGAANISRFYGLSN